VLTAGITAYYMFRMIFLVFFGTYRGEVADEALGIDPQRPAAAAEHGRRGRTRPRGSCKLPVAILIVPTIAPGYVAIGFGGGRVRGCGFSATRSGPSASVAGPRCRSRGRLRCSSSCSWRAAFVVAYAALRRARAQAAAVERLRRDASRCRRRCVHAFYFDDAIDAAIVVHPGASARHGDRALRRSARDRRGVRDLVWLAGALGVIFPQIADGSRARLCAHDRDRRGRVHRVLRYARSAR
jgi:NADH:ubiquinone oxidoreductase subunit 5 (subunit L)/multisubunit Na+/H+ antiporter MnhA subunit